MCMETKRTTVKFIRKYSPIEHTNRIGMFPLMQVVRSGRFYINVSNLVENLYDYT